MICVYFPNSEQKMGFKNHFCVLKNQKVLNAFSDFRREWRLRQFLKSVWTRIIKARHGNSLTLNLHANIVNVNAEKMMLFAFLMSSPPTMSHKRLAMRRLTAVFSAIYAENNFTSWIDSHAFLF